MGYNGDKPITPYRNSWAYRMRHAKPLVVGQKYRVVANLCSSTGKGAPMTLEYAGNGCFTDGHSLYYGYRRDI